MADDNRLDQTADHVLLEKRQKYDEIVKMLIEAGYYRAQIHNLSEFDKVVGGLCWCIVNSGEAVDVDILFTENATIGQRITLSEGIVSAMRQMQCPHPLQPHQVLQAVKLISLFSFSIIHHYFYPTTTTNYHYYQYHYLQH